MKKTIPTVYGNQKDIRRSVTHRQRLKKKLDKMCKYGENGEPTLHGFASVAVQENYVRLLDEGVVVDGGDYVYAVIKKGTLKKWYDSLPKNYVGYINKDHTKAIELGAFTKDDLRLVELADGRYGVDVNFHLDKELYATKDLLHNGNRFAVSAEFYFKTECFRSLSKVLGQKVEEGGDDYLVPVIDEVSVLGYAVVASPKNANSYNEDLLAKASAEERIIMPKKEDMEAKVKEDTLNLEETEAAEEAATEAPETAEETEAIETSEEVEATEEVEQPTEDNAEDSESEDEEEASEEAEEAGQSDVAQKLEETIEGFRAELSEKDKKIAELEAKLAAQTQKESNLNERLAKLLNFASTEEPTEGEGPVETSSEKEEDAYMEALSEAFKNI